MVSPFVCRLRAEAVVGFLDDAQTPARAIISLSGRDLKAKTPRSALSVRQVECVRQRAPGLGLTSEGNRPLRYLSRELAQDVRILAAATREHMKRMIRAFD